MWSLRAALRAVVMVALLVSVTNSQQTPTEEELKQMLETYNTEALDLCNARSIGSWNVATNVGNAAFLQPQIEATNNYAAFMQQQREILKDIDTSAIVESSLIRQVNSIKQIGTAALEEDKLEQFSTIVNRMSNVYSNTVVCPYETGIPCNQADNLRLDPDLEEIMATSTDYNKLKYVWEQWHDKSGSPIRQEYATYVALINDAAEANGLENGAKLWQNSYEDLDFDTIDEMWREVKPLYDALHTYVRGKLTKIYDNDEMRAAAPNMPAHVLGNMWAQTWSNVADRIKPYDIDDNLGSVTQTLLDQNYDARKMFELADEFFVNLGLPSTSMSFNESKAFIVDPMPEQQIDCHASAWDFCKDDDYRIKMCTSVNLRDLNTIHHELGHIAYFQQYSEQPLLLRGAANPGFHEAVGDAISLSFANPKHLKNIGLLQDTLSADDAKKAEINSLFMMAMDRVAFLPFGLLIDKWRWEVFNGTVAQTEWNARWWQLREEYQQIVPPSARSELHFDAGAKYHVPANSQYIGYFFAHLLQFQIYRSMCIAAGQYDPDNPSAAPLNQCVFYGSTEAGDKLKSGLRLGTSKPWPDILEEMTGERTMNGRALMEYFEPLFTYLKQDEQQNLVRQQLVTYSTVASGFCTRLNNAAWDVDSDLHSEEKRDIFLREITLSANFNKEQHERLFKDLNPDDFDDIDVRRQVMLLSKLGVDALPTVQLEERQAKIDDMVLVYNEALVCPFEKPTCDLEVEGMSLNPEIENVLASSNDFDELKYYWSQWHDKTGTYMRSDYQRFVELSNVAAGLNDFGDYGAMLRSDYEDDNLQENLLKLWSEVEPLYDALHTYVRHSLIDKYGEKMDVNDDLIPAHLLGNMWAQSWVNLYESVKPFKNASEIDVSESMKEQMTVLQMFQESDRFYKDLGLRPNEMSYTGLSIIEKPEDRLIVCHASAWDFCDGEDFRIKQCTQIDQTDFVTVHHEMGHIQYFIQYAHQPLPFRNGANGGFHEAVGDLIALSVSTPQHLEKIGLLKDYADTEEDNINALLKMALERVAFMPFSLIIDMYRWEIYSGAVPPARWNARWEELREQYQKIRSPVQRTEANFDAGAKYHVPADVQYAIYFISHVLQFQLHKSVCGVAGQLENGAPLHKCDIDGSKDAGRLIAAGLSAGSSRHWSETLFAMTGDTELKSDAMLEYFAPLLTYLKVTNEQWIAPTTDEPSTDEPSTDEPSTDDPPPNDEEDMPLLPIILGSVIGGLVVIGVFVAVIYYLCKRNPSPPAYSTSKSV